MADTKEYLNQTGENGNINISEEVVASIAALAALEVKGVGDLGTGGIAISELLGKKSLSKGVKVENDENGTIVDVYMTVKYGEIVPTVAAAAQDAVVNALEAMANLSEITVNIHVVGIKFDKE
ncbi:MAG: Asp23/Gls24 family envelope stress response protein [Clostridia bacterium]|nr:Asp23/Gls24 family envelope stress response protein [Clostridia bacterium]